MMRSLASGSETFRWLVRPPRPLVQYQIVWIRTARNSPMTWHARLDPRRSPGRAPQRQSPVMWLHLAQRPASAQCCCASRSLFQSTPRRITEHALQSCVRRTEAWSVPNATMPHQAQRVTASRTWACRRGWSVLECARWVFAIAQCRTPEPYRALA